MKYYFIYQKNFHKNSYLYETKIVQRDLYLIQIIQYYLIYFDFIYIQREKSYVPWPKRFMRAMKKLRKECPGEGYPHRRLAEMKDVQDKVEAWQKNYVPWPARFNKHKCDDLKEAKKTLKNKLSKQSSKISILLKLLKHHRFMHSKQCYHDLNTRVAQMQAVQNKFNAYEAIRKVIPSRFMKKYAKQCYLDLNRRVAQMQYVQAKYEAFSKFQKNPVRFHMKKQKKQCYHDLNTRLAQMQAVQAKYEAFHKPARFSQKHIPRNESDMKFRSKEDIMKAVQSEFKFYKFGKFQDLHKQTRFAQKHKKQCYHDLNTRLVQMANVQAKYEAHEALQKILANKARFYKKSKKQWINGIYHIPVVSFASAPLVTPSTTPVVATPSVCATPSIVEQSSSNGWPQASKPAHTKDLPSGNGPSYGIKPFQPTPGSYIHRFLQKRFKKKCPVYSLTPKGLLDPLHLLAPVVQVKPVVYNHQTENGWPVANPTVHSVQLPSGNGPTYGIKPYQPTPGSYVHRFLKKKILPVVPYGVFSTYQHVEPLWPTYTNPPQFLKETGPIYGVKPFQPTPGSYVHRFLKKIRKQHHIPTHPGLLSPHQYLQVHGHNYISSDPTYGLKPWQPIPGHYIHGIHRFTKLMKKIQKLKKSNCYPYSLFGQIPVAQQMAAITKARWDSVAPGRCFRWMAKKIIRNAKKMQNTARLAKKFKKQSPASCLGRPLPHPIYMGSFVTDKVSADDRSGVQIVDKLPVGAEKWSRLAKKFKKYSPASCLGRPLPHPIYMGSFVTDKVSADDRSGVQIVDKLPVGAEKWSRLAKKFKKYSPASCLGRPLPHPIYMGSFVTDKVSADDRSGVQIVDKLPVGAEKWSFKKRVNKLSKMILKSSRLMKRCTPSLPIHMDSWKVTKIADDDKSGVVLVDNLRPYGRK